MKDKTSSRISIFLVCTVCKARNYRTTKRRDQEVELKKFCKACGEHTPHRESK